MEKEKKQVTVKLTPFEVRLISGALYKARPGRKKLKDKYPKQVECAEKLYQTFSHLNKVLSECEITNLPPVTSTPKTIGAKLEYNRNCSNCGQPIDEKGRCIPFKEGKCSVFHELWKPTD